MNSIIYINISPMNMITKKQDEIAKADRIFIDYKWEDKGIRFKALESQTWNNISFMA